MELKVFYAGKELPGFELEPSQTKPVRLAEIEIQSDGRSKMLAIPLYLFSFKNGMKMVLPVEQNKGRNIWYPEGTKMIRENIHETRRIGDDIRQSQFRYTLDDDLKNRGMVATYEIGPDKWARLKFIGSSKSKNILSLDNVSVMPKSPEFGKSLEIVDYSRPGALPGIGIFIGGLDSLIAKPSHEQLEQIIGDIIKTSISSGENVDTQKILEKYSFEIIPLSLT